MNNILNYMVIYTNPMEFHVMRYVNNLLLNSYTTIALMNKYSIWKYTLSHDSICIYGGSKPNHKCFFVHHTLISSDSSDNK